MNTYIKLIVLVSSILSLSSCMTYEDSYTSSYQVYTYDNSQLYPQSNYPDYYYNYSYKNQPYQQTVSVPDSYHVGAYHSPKSFKDRDRSWVNNQNAQSYTIELADDDKASKVANTLYKTPKTDRMAQVQYQRNGRNYYKGVYGSYSNAEEAQKALNSLPENIKKGASIKSWGSVQKNIE